MKKCNHLSLDTGALMTELQGVAVSALKEEGETLMDAMRQEVRMTVDGNTPGRSAWREHIAQNIEHVSTTIADGGISMEFGYAPKGEADEARAMVVAYGSGDKAEGGGTPIHAGPAGRRVWDDELSGRKSSNAKSEYNLPAEFNQRGNLFVDNALKRTKIKFGGHLETAFRSLPSAVFYRKVAVKKS